MGFWYETKVAHPMAEEDFDSDSSAWAAYSVYGITLASDFPFQNRLLRATGPAQLTFTCVSAPFPAHFWRHAELVYASPFKVENGESNYRLYRVPNGHVLRFADLCAFHIQTDRIVCHLLDPGCGHLVEILLLGTVLSFVLEMRDVPVLHAAAVAIGTGAVAFLADNKGGKSSLAASFMRGGHGLLTDDILAVRSHEDAYLAEPGYPQMRLWPDQAAHFVDDHERLELVDPTISKRRVPVGSNGLGSFCDRPRPLTCLYSPARRTEQGGSMEVEIRTLPMAEALFELVRHSFIPNTVEAMGLQPVRLARFAKILQQVPVRRLYYPSGVEHLPRTCRAVIDDLSTLDSRI